MNRRLNVVIVHCLPVRLPDWCCKTREDWVTITGRRQRGKEIDLKKKKKKKRSYTNKMLWLVSLSIGPGMFANNESFRWLRRKRPNLALKLSTH
ncbi:hypothetical protein INR49_017359 [Caranx melampygus]|nr:hypothetical protein INR49_017359 [Caranx melampygus]